MSGVAKRVSPIPANEMTNIRISRSRRLQSRNFLEQVGRRFARDEGDDHDFSAALLNRLPLNTGLGFVLVQHLHPEHESALTQLLARVTSIPVLEVTNNLRIEPDHVYVIPPNAKLSIYPDAGHGFQNPVNGEGYKPADTADAWKKITAFFAGTLKK